MSKIQRTTQKIFGGNAPTDDIAALGSFKTGTPLYSDDIATLQNSAYEQGYGATLVANEAPFMEEQNSVPYILSTQLAYTFQEGIPEYDADTNYFIGSIVKSLDGNNVPVLYYSLNDNNHGNLLTNNTHWKKMDFGADNSLSNLTSEGEKHFLNKAQITNCILSAPNGVATYSGSTITLKQGLTMLYPNGRNLDKTLKNGELTLEGDIILDLSDYSGQTFDFELMFGCNINDNYLSQNYQESDVAPTKFSGFNQIYLNTTENHMYFYNSSLSSWEKKIFIKLGKGKIENGVITSLIPYQPMELLKRSDKEQITYWAYPSDKYVNLTLGASGTTYTAPANGYFTIMGTSTSAFSWIRLYDTTTNLSNQQTSYQSGNGMSIFLPARKDKNITLSYLNASINTLRFVYANGEV